MKTTIEIINLVKRTLLPKLQRNVKLKDKTMFCIFILLNYCLIAQPTIEWEKNYGGPGRDEPTSIQQTTDNGYIVAGEYGGNYGIIKLDVSGNLQWEKNYGGPGRDEPTSIQQTTDGGYIVAGYSESSGGDVNGNYGANDYWIIKLNELGDLIWNKNYGGTLGDSARSIQQTIDGGYIVAGSSLSNDENVGGNNGGQDYWVIKLDQLGNLQWEENYGTASHDRARSIQQTIDGGCIVAGYSNYDAWIVKLDELGNLQWEESYGYVSNDFAYSIQQTTDGGYVVAGSSLQSGGTYNYWIVKLDELGNFLWQKIYGGNWDDWAYSIQQTTDGGYIIAGSSGSNNGDVGGNNGLLGTDDYWIVKLDNLGDLLWEKNYGGTGSDRAHSIQQTTDGGYVVAGYSSSNDGDVSGNNGSGDFWILKLSGTENSNTDVYPGDLNYDGICNHLDRSISYVHFGESGPYRTPGGIAWEAQDCQDWGTLQNNGHDIKHHDCDGNGNINSQDLNAINLNYGKTHPLPSGIIQFPIPVYTNTDFQILLQPINQVLNNNNTLTMNVVMDSKSGQNLEMFGGHFSIDYSNIVANVNSAVMNFESQSWLGSPGINLLAESWHNTNEHSIEVGFTKTNGMASIGKGVIGKAIFLLNTANLNRSNSCENLLDVAITKIGSFNANQDSLQIEEEYRTVNIGTPCCEPFIIIDENTAFQNLYQSSGTITTNGYLPIGQNQQVEYNANRVTLNEGFSAKAGVDFKIRSSECN